MNRTMGGLSNVLPLLSLALLCCAFATNVSASTTVQVLPEGGNPCLVGLQVYYSIQAAINIVPAGSTVKVCPGTYAEQVSITKNLTLTGAMDNPVIVAPAKGLVANATDPANSGSPIAAQVAVVAPVGQSITVNISNLAVDGSNNQIGGCSPDPVGIYYENASGTVEHVATRFQEFSQSLFGCQGGLAIYAVSGYGTGGTSTITIEDNSVHDYDKNGITVDGSGTTATVTGNYVVGIGATSLTAQNGIQVSDGATGTVSNNIVTDDVYINPANCQSSNSCFSASGILLFNSGTGSAGVAVSGNTVSNTQGAVVTFASEATADNNTITSNKITSSPAAGPFEIDGIDMCSNNNTARSNTVYNSSGSGVHIDSSCNETGAGTSGQGSSATSNTVNEACVGVLTGNNGGTQTSTTAYNVVQVTATGDSCPAGAPIAMGARAQAGIRLKPSPRR